MQDVHVPIGRNPRQICNLHFTRRRLHHRHRHDSIMILLSPCHLERVTRRTLQTFSIVAAVISSRSATCLLDTLIVTALW